MILFFDKNMDQLRIYFTQRSHNTGCQKLGIVLENKVFMYFQNWSYQKISISENDKRCVLMYLANFRSWTVLSTLASSTSILIGDCLFPLQAEKYVDKKFKYSKVYKVLFTVRYTNRQITALTFFAITKTIAKIARKGRILWF